MNLAKLLSKHVNSIVQDDIDHDLSAHLTYVLRRCEVFKYPTHIRKFYSQFLIHALAQLLKSRLNPIPFSKVSRVRQHLIWFDSNHHSFQVESELLRLYRECLVGIIIYYKQGFLNDQLHLNFFRLYVFSGGSSNHILSLLIDDLDFDPTLHSLSPSFTDEFNEFVEKGYAILPGFLDQYKCSELIDTVKNDLFYANPNSNKQIHLPKSAQFPLDTRYTYSNSRIVEHMNYVSLFENTTITSIASKYLRTRRPILSIVGLNATFSYESSPCAESAQLYHWDLDSIKWIKFFLYLSDVDNQSGPHAYFPGSHHEFSKPWPLLSQGYARIHDDDIKSFYSDIGINPVSIQAPAGTLIIANTHCYHKGTPCSTGKMRWMLQLEYTINRILRDINKPCSGITSSSKYARYLIN